MKIVYSAIFPWPLFYFQAANQFSSALTSGQMGPVMTQFGLAPEVTAAANTGDMQAFFKALETSSSGGSEDKSDDKKKDNDKSKDDKPKEDPKDKKDGDPGMSVE